MNVVDVRGSRLDADVWDPTGATIKALDEKWPPDEPGEKIYRDGDLFRDHSGGDAFPGIVRHAAGRPQLISQRQCPSGENPMKNKTIKIPGFLFKSPAIDESRHHKHLKHP